MTALRFVLASASPARLALLRSAGLDPEVIVSGVDESGVNADDVPTLTAVLAQLKATEVAPRVDGGAIVLGCDSLLEFEGRPLGKPRDAEEATARWKSMRGGTGVLHTGHCLVDTRHDRVITETSSAVIHFADPDDAEIAAYVATGEPLQVAGSFTIDGPGGFFVDGIEGDPGTVVGVSLPLLRRMLADLDVPVQDLWA